MGLTMGSNGFGAKSSRGTGIMGGGEANAAPPSSTCSEDGLGLSAVALRQHDEWQQQQQRRQQEQRPQQQEHGLQESVRSGRLGVAFAQLACDPIVEAQPEVADDAPSS